MSVEFVINDLIVNNTIAPAFQALLKGCSRYSSSIAPWLEVGIEDRFVTASLLQRAKTIITSTHEDYYDDTFKRKLQPKILLSSLIPESKPEVENPRLI